MNISNNLNPNVPNVSPTPLQEIPLLGDAIGVDLRVKRDDYYPLYGGGSKARKASYIVPWAKAQGHDSIVTNGGINSNHARATALACVTFGLHCELVLHTSNPAAVSNSLNLQLIKLAGTSLHICKLAELSTSMDKIINELVDRGNNPLYLWGGGHCTQGAIAYYEAAHEVFVQSPAWQPDFVIVASGTGTTQAGLLAGFRQSSSKVIGISIAREAERGKSVVYEAWSDLELSLGRAKPNYSEVEFLDDWRLGGYEIMDNNLASLIKTSMSKGLILDPTYTAKAWLALTELVHIGRIPKGSKVLFWHTGGIYNLLSNKVICE